MADIAVKNLATHDSGYDLFNDSENFMAELTDQDESNILGGCIVGTHYPTRSRCTPYTLDVYTLENQP